MILDENVSPLNIWNNHSGHAECTNSGSPLIRQLKNMALINGWTLLRGMFNTLIYGLIYEYMTL